VFCFCSIWFRGLWWLRICSVLPSNVFIHALQLVVPSYYERTFVIGDEQRHTTLNNNKKVTYIDEIPGRKLIHQRLNPKNQQKTPTNKELSSKPRKRNTKNKGTPLHIKRNTLCANKNCTKNKGL